MRQSIVEVRPVGKDWENCVRFVTFGVTITSNGDLVVQAGYAEPVGDDGQGNLVMHVRMQHAFSAGTWAEFRDVGDVPETGRSN